MGATNFRLQPALDGALAAERAARRDALRARRAWDDERASLAALEARIAALCAGLAPAALGLRGGPGRGQPLALGARLDAEACLARLRDERERGHRVLAALSDVARELETACAHRTARRRGLERFRDRRQARDAHERAVAEEGCLDEGNAGRRGSFTALANADPVIALHRGNGQPVIVNADLIETVEPGEGGETVVTLTTGNVLAVREAPLAVRAAALEYRRSIAAS